MYYWVKTLCTLAVFYFFGRLLHLNKPRTMSIGRRTDVVSVNMQWVDIKKNYSNFYSSRIFFYFGVVSSRTFWVMSVLSDVESISRVSPTGRPNPFPSRRTQRRSPPHLGKVVSVLGVYSERNGKKSISAVTPTVCRSTLSLLPTRRQKYEEKNQKKPDLYQR